jgi:hypothetical protein
MTPRTRRIFGFSVVLVAVLAVAMGLLLRHANELIRDRIVQSLGSEFQIGSMELHWNMVELRSVQYAREGRVMLHADRVAVRADLFASLGGTVSVDSVEIEKPYAEVSIDRSGAVTLPVPSAPSASSSETSGIPSFSLAALRVSDGTVLVTDARLPASSNTLRLDSLRIVAGNLAFPFTEAPMEASIDARAGGALLAGTIHADASVKLGTDAVLRSRITADNIVLLDAPPHGPVARAEQVVLRLSVRETDTAVACMFDEVTVTKPVLRIATDLHGDIALPDPWGRFVELIRSGAARKKLPRE